MNRDLRWALGEGSLFFEGKGAVQDTLRKITQRLNTLGIPYAVVDGMALFMHGLRRFTEDVDILVTASALKEIHARLEGLGYLPPFNLSKNLRDTETGVKIEFLITGGFPGDGLPKPVAFPNPQAVAVENNYIRYINLPTLIELKLASGMSNINRMKDLTDVLELIKVLNLPKDFEKNLNPYVRDKFLELWNGARPPQKRYALVIAASDQDSAAVKAMLADGVAVDPTRGAATGHRWLVTTDPQIASKYGMHDESELWEE